MRWKDKLLMRIRMLFSRNRAGQQLQDELSFHLDQQIRENLAAGMSPAEARQAAVRLFGNPTLCGSRPAPPGAGRASKNWAAT